MVSRMKCGAYLLLVVLAGSSCGCSAKSDGATSVSGSSSAPQSVSPPSPQEAAGAVLADLKASKPVAVWDLLSTDDQFALNKAITSFAESIDAEVWDRTVRNLKKLVGVLETKRDFAIESPLWRTGGAKLADVKANWTPTVNLLKAITQSELVDQQKMKQFDGRKFLEGTGAKLYADARELFKLGKSDPFKRIEELKVTVKESTPETATLVLESPKGGGKPLQIHVTLRNGKWVPGELSLLVDYVITRRVPSYFKLFSHYCQIDWKDQYLHDMDRLEKALDRLQAAKTSDEFQSIVGRDLLPFALAKLAQVRKGPPTWHGVKAASYKRAAPTVMILIKGDHRLKEPAVGALLTTLGKATSAPGFLSGPRTLDGMTVFLIENPDLSVDAIAKSITVAKVTEIDARRKTLTCELPGSSATGPATAEASHKAPAKAK